MEEQEKPKVKKGKKSKAEKVEEVKLSSPPETVSPIEIVPEELKEEVNGVPKEESKQIKNLDDAGKSIGEKVENQNFFDWLIKLILDFFKK